MHKRGLKVALVAVLTLVFVLGAVGVASAQWTDLSMSILGDYGVTEQQVANISDGFPDGTWRPYQAMPRNQFVKMAVDAYKIPLVSPATPTYSDVPASDYYFAYIEGATAAGLTNGVGGGKFEPNMTVTREQAAAIISRWVADQNGYNLETMYTDADAAAILASFPDAASVSPSLQKEMAFAVDFGIVWGNASGMLAAKTGMSRIQGAAMLIRSLDIIPLTEPVVPADIELLSDDEAENLIGLTHQYTYKVTQADGSAAPGVLVDFDTLIAPWYVGNVEPEAALTDANGEVTINLISTEVGIQRVSAAAPGVAAMWSTKYWVALDEVYILDEDLEAENNAGETHTWSARVLVFGPGPLSTSQADWYNLYLPSGDPGRPLQADGIDADDDYSDAVDYTSYDDELDWLIDGYLGRSLEGIPVFWQIRNVVDDKPSTSADETVPSVGAIVAAVEDGEIAADGMSAWAFTDADGLTSIDIMSEQTGKTVVTAEANYDGNPYEWQLFDHETNNDYEDHFDNWQNQPAPFARAVKTWIPHVIGGDSDAPITPLYAVNNTGEVETFTLTLEDTFGNPIPGYTVEWWLQGAGFFKSDGTTWVGIGEQNKDVDVTNSLGQATVDLKSILAGQTIVHVKVMDKFGLPYKEWNVVKQWYSIDDVTLGQFDEDGLFEPDNTATNVVNTGHTWVAAVSGAKYVYTIYDLNQNGLRDDQVLIGDRADMKAAAGAYANFDGTMGASKAANVDVAVAVPFKLTGGDAWYIRFADMDLADNEFWMDGIGRINKESHDGIDEVWAGLAGKSVYFFNNVGRGSSPSSNTPMTTIVSGQGLPEFVGTITSPAKVVTDDMGFAEVDINSTNKGFQYIYAVADYLENPQDGNPLLPLEWKELRWDVATKTWTPTVADLTKIKIFAQDALIEGDRWTNPILPFAGYPGSATVTIAAPPAGTAATGTATVAGDVVTGITIVTGGTGYSSLDVGRAITIGAPTVGGSGAAATATLGTTPPTNNSVGLITVTNGGSGYTVAPTVVISAPQIAGGTQATATATLGGNSVVSVTVTAVGSGYTAAPTVTFSTGGTQATATIATVAAGAVTGVTLTNGGTGYPTAPAVTFPAPLRTQATATATVVGGVVTGLTLTNAGAGYVTAPLVTITGNGTGAAALATVNADGTISLTLVSGGSGYFAVNTTPSTNPNRDTIAIQVFDTFGNALEGYKVTWEVVGQGTTTPGTIPTYHPYAHFENPAHDFVVPAGLGDLNPFVNANLIWDRSATAGRMDDDYAWGYTLNHQINFTKDLASAAHVDLVLDESLAQLAGRSHITNIVNIQVFDPNGVRVLEKEVTKVWSTAPPVLTTIDLSVGNTNVGPWVTSLTSNVSTLWYRARLFDQYGDPWTSNANVRARIIGPFPDSTIFAIAAPNPQGVAIAQLPGMTVVGLHTIAAFYDINPADGLLSPTELTSNSATVTVQ